MAERGHVWTDVEVRCLLAIWSEESIQRELKEAYRNNQVWEKIARELKKQDSSFNRSSKQCSTKIKQLKKQYKDEVDKLRKSGVGVESEDEDDLFVSFKWFFEVHQVMKGRAVVNPPALLESSSTSRSSTPAADLHSEDYDSHGPFSPISLEPATIPSPLPATSTPSSLQATSMPSSLLATTPPSSLPATSTPSSLPATAPSSLSATSTPSSLPTTAPSSLSATSTPSSPPATSTPSFLLATASSSLSATTTPSSFQATSTPSSNVAKTTPSSASGTVGPLKKKRKLTKLEQADKTSVKMFESILKANKEFEERQERLQEE